MKKTQNIIKYIASFMFINTLTTILDLYPTQLSWWFLVVSYWLVISMGVDIDD